ncbi:NAD(P)/FAD-dependent oxidoreductase [Mycolicibacterium sp. P9-22]|uniref:FAD-dependent oxidoreductase n=1 Tax=Mycolicibacterium sp. P9-22 TaxID=2024613 RepID=UPI0011ED357D|nr:hypothetical protein [Mycolicibacterium sp. P9-22]KAA0120633.1 hypothetical protein CIW51_04020 [Mycolicibacterium sp. P9-22]
MIGGSIAGCAAAAALHRKFERVVVVDRDELPLDPAPRKGAPHAHQYHALNLAGRMALEDLFPGLTDQALADGVPQMDPTQDMLYCSKAGFWGRQASSMRSLLPTRLYLEWLVRNRTRKIPNVEFIERTTATGLRASNGEIVGVDLRGLDTAATRSLDAGLVVDASGRSSVAPEWLEALGYPTPVEHTVNAKWGYATTYVRPGPQWSPPFEALYIGPTLTGDGLHATRGAAMWAQENGLWVLTAQGCAGDYPPAQESEFRDFLGSFGRTEFLQLFDSAELVRPIIAWRNTTNRLRDYAGLPSRPERFVVLGDATAAFNPVYGQGMAVSAVGARLMGSMLEEWPVTPTSGLTGFAEQYQKRLNAEVIQGCWDFSVGSDFNVPGVEIDGAPKEASEKPAEQEFVDRVIALATEDDDVHLKLMEMMQMMRGPEWMAADDLRAKVEADWDRLGHLTRTNEPLVTCHQ